MDPATVSSSGLSPSLFLGLPPEMRLMVYDNVQDLHHAQEAIAAIAITGAKVTNVKQMHCEGWCINDRTMVQRLSAQHRTGLASLSQTCRLINKEAHNLLYKSTFSVLIKDLPPNLRSRMPTFAGHEFLRHVTRLHVRIEVDEDDLRDYKRDGSIVAGDLDLLQSMLDDLKQSTTLRSMSFEVAGNVRTTPRYEELAATLKETRRKSTRDGAKVGKRMKERELDYAQMVVDTFKGFIQGMTEESKGTESPTEGFGWEDTDGWDDADGWDDTDF